MATFKHNKKRNTGLVYEFLIRRVSKGLLDGDKKEASRALEIVRKYYGEGTALNEERELFEVVRNSRGLSEGNARRVLAEVQRAAAKMDGRKIDIKKSNLIKEVNYGFGKDFFSEHRIPDYRLLASIQLVIDASRGPVTLTESVSNIQLEEVLVQHMTSKDAPLQPKDTAEMDALVMRMVAKRFEEKYSASFSPGQKRLLERFVRYQVTGDKQIIESFMESERKRISTILEKALRMKEVRDDPEMVKQLNEARGGFDTKLHDAIALDDRVQEMFLYEKLAEEIESDD